MAAFVKYQSFITELGKGTHKLHAAGDTFKVILTNTAPNAATHALRGDVTELSTGNGYTSGGIDIQNDYTGSGGTGTMTAVDCTFTASGGTIGPFRYAIIYNDTPSSPLDPLMGYYDYGSSITLQDTETFSVDFGASLATFA